MLRKLIIFSIVLATVGFQYQGCEKPDDEMVPIGHGKAGKAHFVYFYSKSATYEEIRALNDYVTSVSEPNRSERKIYKDWSLVRVDGYEGYEMMFKPDATEEGKNLIKQKVRESPFIYKTFENVDSRKLVLDPVEAKKEKERREKSKKDKRPNKKEGKVSDP